MQFQNEKQNELIDPREIIYKVWGDFLGPPHMQVTPAASEENSSEKENPWKQGSLNNVVLLL